MTKLFKDVYYVNLEGWHQFSKPYTFIHGCCCSLSSIYPDDVAIIWPSGKCRKCNTYILSYKKLEVMRALKELTG